MMSDREHLGQIHCEVWACVDAAISEPERVTELIELLDADDLQTYAQVAIGALAGTLLRVTPTAEDAQQYARNMAGYRR